MTALASKHTQLTLCIYIGVGIGVAVLMVTAIVLIGTTTFIFHKGCKSKKDHR